MKQITLRLDNDLHAQVAQAAKDAHLSIQQWYEFMTRDRLEDDAHQPLASTGRTAVRPGPKSRTASKSAKMEPRDSGPAAVGKTGHRGGSRRTLGTHCEHRIRVGAYCKTCKTMKT